MRAIVSGISCCMPFKLVSFSGSIITHLNPRLSVLSTRGSSDVRAPVARLNQSTRSQSLYKSSGAQGIATRGVNRDSLLFLSHPQSSGTAARKSLRVG